MKSARQAKTAAKALRKELANLNKPVQDLSLNEAQHLLARMFGYDNWNTLIPTLEDDPLPQVNKLKTGFQPVSVDSEAGRLPAYYYKGLTVSLDYLPDADQDSLYLDFSVAGKEGLSDSSEDNFSIPCGYLSARDTSATAFKARQTFVKEVAKLVAPYLTENTGLRALDAALCQLGEGDFSGARERLERTKLSAGARSLAHDEVKVGEFGKLETLTGEAVIGTFDSLRACAMVQGATRKPDGTLELEWEGETDVWWDEQRTIYQNDEPMFVTEAHNLVPLSQVRVVPD